MGVDASNLPPKYPAYLPNYLIYTYLVGTDSILVYDIFLWDEEREPALREQCGVVTSWRFWWW